GVVAFDISPTAIDGARGRFPGSAVDYTPGDLLNPPASWRGAFDLVVEIYTVQPPHGTARPTPPSLLPLPVAPPPPPLPLPPRTSPPAPGQPPPEPAPATSPCPFPPAETAPAAALPPPVKIDPLHDETSPALRWRAEFNRRA